MSSDSLCKGQKERPQSQQIAIIFLSSAQLEYKQKNFYFAHFSLRETVYHILQEGNGGMFGVSSQKVHFPDMKDFPDEDKAISASSLALHREVCTQNKQA